MSQTLQLIPNFYPNGIDETQRSVYVEGQVLPYDSSNAIIQITAASLTSNVVTFTAANSLTTTGSQAIFVAGFEGATDFLNGGYTTTSATSSTITVPLTHANLATTSVQALATLAPNYATGGLAVGGYLNKLGQATFVPQVGPLQTLAPKKLNVFSLSGTRNYPVNMNTGTTAPLVLSYTLTGTQATNAAALPADSIGFKAEYVKDGF